MGILLIILPITACVLAAVGVRRAGQSRLSAVMIATVAAGVWVALSTEVLSANGWLTRWGFIIAWAAACIAALVTLLAIPARAADAEQPTRAPFNASERLMGAAMLLVMLLTFATAISSVPNNWDSMTYHLPRVMHWWQNGSVGHYDTSISRQLYQPPLAEFSLLHIFALTGADRLLNLLQWVAMGGGLVATASITKSMGGSRTAQLLAALLVATIPSVALQASNTKNTLVLAMWLLIAVALLLEARSAEARGRPWLLLASGLAIGLSVLTHGMAPLLVLPVGVWWLCVAWRAMRWHSAAPIVAAIVVSCLLNVPHWRRNEARFDNLLGDQTADYRNTSHSPGVIASNALRSLSLHFATPWESTNESIANGVGGALGVAGIDASDAGITWGGTYIISPRVFNEDYAPAPLHVVLCLTGLIVALARPPTAQLRALAIVVAVQLLLFCLVLKWQVWHTRLHAPMLMLAMPCVAVLLATRFKAVLVAPTAVLACLAAMPALLWNESRPLLGAENVRTVDVARQYFASWPVLGDDVYLPAIEQLRQQPWEHLGLAISADSYEYPVWRLLALPRGARLTHEAITPIDQLHHSEQDAHAPQGILCVAVELPGDMLACRGHAYRLVWVQPSVAIYWRVDLLQ